MAILKLYHKRKNPINTIEIPFLRLLGDKTSRPPRHMKAGTMLFSHSAGLIISFSFIVHSEDVHLWQCVPTTHHPCRTALPKSHTDTSLLLKIDLVKRQTYALEYIYREPCSLLTD
jgi:hypothetical protein